ncbi:MAG: formimidoylglutamase [Cytophagales bacterium CG12_big_fil_rev_8_21_14_0_65_40_12]|nr:MAG: formimidoylglutamase [Cytophagales bacterium CG12_big_fil_rev_8_21_14_0_65_40_12]PIW03457.1 MAG: formimidoylglutamase [Cytophagales bacterium CG17_big_fil_post_rev_8_21_14_2_50_40_13]
MIRLKPADKQLWKGRNDPNFGRPNYWHELVELCELDDLKPSLHSQIALLGYACEEGVRRNQGRLGAAQGPDAIRKMLAVLPNHFEKETSLLDLGNIECDDQQLETTQAFLSRSVTQLLEAGAFPILLGGGHDIAYAHYAGIRDFLNQNLHQKNIGVINLDAHFDLRDDEQGNTSGTPFFQIAQDCKASNQDFNYLCLGIQKAANTKTLFETAENLGAVWVQNTDFSVQNWAEVELKLLSFIQKVDAVYLTIDLDGFSSAYAPGVSAPSPMGFAPDVVLKTLEVLMQSKKVISIDLAEMNPVYDQDHATARLAARLVHFIADLL